jgi:integrase
MRRAKATQTDPAHCADPADYSRDASLPTRLAQGIAGAWKAISRQQHWHIIVEACKVAETKLEGFSHQDFGSHSARKTVVTVLTDSTGDILIASRYIGHKGIGVTQAYYKANPRRERENVGKMVALILPAVAA